MVLRFAVQLRNSHHLEILMKTETIPATRPSPAQRVIEAFKGVRATARIVKRNSSTISRWLKPRGEGGTGGLIPSSLQKAILDHAAANGIALTADDLIA